MRIICKALIISYKSYFNFMKNKNKTLILTILLIFQLSVGQEKNALGISFGLGKSLYRNKFETDNNHFKFNNPTSINIGMQYIRYLSSKNQIILNFDYTSKAIEMEYKLNEPNIPYSLKDNISEEYRSLSLSIGFRKTFLIQKKIKPFTEISLNGSYNINDEIVSSGNGNGTSNQELSVDNELLYNNLGTNNLGEESLVLGTNLGVGLIFGKKNQYEIIGNINIPFTQIQNRTSTYRYLWQYQGKTYNHNLNYKGAIFYPNLKFVYYVFKK